MRNFFLLFLSQAEMQHIIGIIGGNLLMERRTINEQLANGQRTVNKDLVKMCARD